MNLQRLQICVICVAGLLFALQTISHAQETLPRFESSECLIEIPDSPTIQCGYLVVPEDYDEPEGAAIRLPIIIIRSRSQNPAPDPILFTQGGPGYSSLESVWWMAQSEFVNERDAIIMEQRGNLYSQPNLACDISMWVETEPGHTPCLDNLQAKGIDLRHYTTAVITADIESLRQALGVEQWNLYGTSYSTRLMQLAMQTYPAGIRSVILQSISSVTETRYEYDPKFTARALNVMLEDCAADPACAAAYPHLETQLYETIKKLNDAPVSFEVTDSESGETVTETVDGVRLLDWMMVETFYGPTWPPHKTAYMPLLIDQVARGKTELLFPWLEAQINRHFWDTNFAWGLYFSINCQDDAAAFLEMSAGETAVYPQLDGYLRYARELEICEAWNLPAAPPLATEPIVSDIPTLIIAGSYDPVTPPSWGQALFENLSSGYYYEFPSAGHNVGTDNPCAKSIKLAFLNDPTTAPDASCMTAVPGPTFVLPDEIAIAPGVYRIVDDIDLGNPTRGKPVLEFFAGSSLVLFLLAVGYLLVAGVVGVVRRQPNQTEPDWVARGLPVVAGLTAVTGWATIIVLSKIINHLTHTNWTILYFGLPLEYPPVLYLAILALLFFVLTVGLLILLAAAWQQRCCSLWARGFFTLVSAAAVLFSVLIMRWDLHLLLF